ALPLPPTPGAIAPSARVRVPRTSRAGVHPHRAAPYHSRIASTSTYLLTAPGQDEADRTCLQRSLVSGRSQRNESNGAGEVPARSPGTRVPEIGRHTTAHRKGPSNRRDDPRSATGSHTRGLSRGSLLPAGGVRHQTSTAS